MHRSFHIDELTKVLVLDEDEFVEGAISFSGSSSYGGELARQVEFWRRLRVCVCGHKAQRLLSEQTGELLSRAQLEAYIAQVWDALNMLTVDGASEWHKQRVRRPVLDLLISLNPLGLGDTYESRWNRIDIITALAESYRVKPSDFFVKISGAHDWVLRVTSSPDQYRAAVYTRLEGLMPDRLERVFRRQYEELNRQFGSICVQELVSRQLQGLQGDNYWALRAGLLQQMEERIARVWPYLSNPPNAEEFA
ncbi:MAG: hypothetical protein UY76_C0028G0009 [Candidatus Uhrbacteria bacterium GW2011_GWA2_52_8d]|uniref:Uncharacterized protein n=1 Tax=Candidatus Uhrbacteria bacterium GW2011_GWA2_52_8d TaxID=1618979 RepID=A0A0G1XMC6_9BACT|nr:MAG: hypothetical protein UY76_C0028G0009 [Candidatus Uhrbacteria bacterium GW2011_GWA2_52_8d]